jgi:CxxC motif-containing protein (DUF1111 family)
MAFADGVDTQPAMGDPLPGLSPEQLDDFFIGKTAYNTELLQEEGLGPIFNKEFCGNCHSSPANSLGGPGSQTVTRFGLNEKGGFNPMDDWGGSLLQVGFIVIDGEDKDHCQEEIPELSNVQDNRVTNGMMGYGLVEAILDDHLLNVMDEQPANMRGTPHMVVPLETPGGDERVGRFGWKAQVATILTFSGDAALNEMGLTNDLVGDENDPNGIFDPPLEDCDFVDDPEDNVNMGNGVDKKFIEVVTDFQRFLAPPPQTPKSGMSGEDVFISVGCAVCHHPEFTTPDDPGLEDAIRNKTVRMYSDFLLHDAGIEGDFIQQGPGTSTMMKTPPLSGLRHRDPIWHNGEIGGGTFETRINMAIDRHFVIGADANRIAEDYAMLPEEDKDALIAFLRSLGKREFDVEEVGSEQIDNAITEFDFGGFGQDDAFAPCYLAGGNYDPDHPCAVHDIDQDGDVDDDDFKSFLTVYSGALEDCNANGEDDLIDILSGTSVDANGDAIPDECTCPDTDGDGLVTVTDMVNVILNWGPCEGVPCTGDVNFDGMVDVEDLVEVILAWGSCF